jgi:hypothetical protein
MPDWRFAMNVSKSTAVLYEKASWRAQRSGSAQFLGEPKQWVEIARLLGVTVEVLSTCNRVVKQARRRHGVFGPHVNRRSSSSVRIGVIFCKQLTCPMMDYVP